MARLNIQHRRQFLSTMLSHLWGPLFALILAMFGYLPCLLSQPSGVSFTRISVEHGLPNSDVNAILQDSRGFMWFGTSGGLSKFDGYEFTHFKKNPADTNSLSDDAIVALCEDRNKNLWVGTYGGGLNKLVLADRNIRKFIHNPLDPTSMASNEIKSVYEDASGALWIGTWFDGLDRFDQSTGKFMHYRHDSLSQNSLSDNNIRSLVEDKDRILWIGTATGGVAALDPSRTKLTRFKHRLSDPFSLSSDAVKTLFVDADGFVWVGTDNGLNRFDKANGKFTRFNQPLSDKKHSTTLSVYAIGEALRGNQRTFWIGTQGNGIYQFDPPSGTFARFASSPPNTTDIGSDVIRCMFTDRTGGLWIGTEGGGVSKLSTERQPAIHHLRYDPKSSNSISKGSIWSLCADPSGSVWAGTLGEGLNNVVLKTGVVTRYTSASNRLSDNSVTALHIDRSGTLWVGTYNTGLDRFDRATRRFINYSTHPQNPKSISSNQIDEIYEDNSGTLWIGTTGVSGNEGGLNKFDQKTGTFQQFKYDPGNPQSLGNDRVSALFEDSKGTLWIGTEGGGLNALNRATMQFTRYVNSPAHPKSLSNDRVYSIQESQSGALWIGTANGLNLFERKTGEFTQFFQRDGLPSDYIRSILPDAHGNIWLVTTRGISKFNPRLKTFVNYDSHDGFLSDDFTDANCVDKMGVFYLGSQYGLTYFHPDSIVDNVNPPPVVISSFNIFEKPYAISLEQEQRPEVSLNANENFLSFVIASLDYTNPSKNLYAYKMEELDADWVKSGNRRYASYPGLQPGSYVFRVIGSNNHGVWNTEGSSLSIIINPPWWKTGWFRILAAAVLIGIGAAIYNYRVSKLLEMERMRVRIASDLHDDIGSSLSSIAMITDVVRRRLPIDTPDSSHLATATSAARSATDALRNIVWSVNPEHDTLDATILKLKDTASQLLTGLDFKFESNGHAGSNILGAEFRHNLLMIYREVLNNTIKHAKATHIDILVDVRKAAFVLRISDNGVGFAEEKITRGHGLNNLRRRALKLGGTIEIKSSVGNGTTTELLAKLP